VIYNPVRVKQIVENGENYTILEDAYDTECKIKRGQKVAQISLVEHKSYLMGVDTTKKRTGGFGSTGK